MVAQPPELMRKFLLDIPQKLGIAGIARARTHHVVPEKDTVLVAGFVEFVMFELATAPHAKHVHVGVRRRLDKVAVLLPRLPVLECVAWNPIGPLAEHTAVVDNNLQTSTFAQNLEFAKTDTAAHTLELILVETPISHSVRPPQRWVVNLNDLLRARTVRFVGNNRQCAMRKIVIEFLRRVNVVRPRHVRGNKRHRTAETGHHLRGPPVPAAVAGVLADNGQILGDERIGHRMGERLRTGDFKPPSFRTLENTANDIAANLQRPLDIELVALETVCTRSDLDVIDENRSKTIHVLQPQNNFAGREDVTVDIKFARYHPVMLTNPLGVDFIASPIRIVH